MAWATVPSNGPAAAVAIAADEAAAAADRAEIARAVAAIYAKLPDDPAGVRAFVHCDRPVDAAFVVPALSRWSAAWRAVRRASDARFEARKAGDLPPEPEAARSFVRWPSEAPTATPDRLSIDGKTAAVLADEFDDPIAKFRRSADGGPWTWDLSAQFKLDGDPDAATQVAARLDAMAAAAEVVAKQVAAGEIASAGEAATEVDRILGRSLLAKHLTDGAAAPAVPPAVPDERRIASGCGKVSAMAAAPDGRSFVTAAVAAGDPVRVWDYASGKPVRSLRPEGVAVFEGHRVAYSPSGDRVAVVGAAYRTSDVYAAFTEPDGAAAVPNRPGLGGQPATIYDRFEGSLGAWLFDPATGRQVARLDADRRDDLGGPVAFSADGKWVAGSRGTESFVWEAKTGKVVGKGLGGGDALAFAADGTLYTIQAGGWLNGYDVTTGAQRSRATLPDDGFASRTLEALLVSADGKSAVYATTSGATRVDVATGKPIVRHRIPRLDGLLRVGTLQLSSDGNRLLGACGNPAADGNPAGMFAGMASKMRLACVWDARTGRPTHTFAGPVGAVTAAAFVEDGAAVLATSTDGTIRVWPVKAGN